MLFVRVRVASPNFFSRAIIRRYYLLYLLVYSTVSYIPGSGNREENMIFRNVLYLVLGLLYEYTSLALINHFIHSF